MAAATEAFVNVKIPEGLSAGQQVSFTTPDGQQMMVKVRDAVAPGEMIRIAYQPLSVTGTATTAGLTAETQQTLPAVPVALSLDADVQATMMRQALLPRVTVSGEEKDRVASEKSWTLYVISMLCCCLCPAMACFVSPLMWIGVACAHYSKTPAERIRFPKQRAPAFISLATCIVSTACACVFLAGATGVGLGVALVGVGAGQIMETLQDFKAVESSCVSIKAFGDAACEYNFTVCHRFPTPTERMGICQEVAIKAGACAQAVKQRGAKHSFDLLCSKEGEELSEWFYDIEMEQMQDERKSMLDTTYQHHHHHHNKDAKKFMMWSRFHNNGHWGHHHHKDSEGIEIQNFQTFPTGVDVQV